MRGKIAKQLRRLSKRTSGDNWKEEYKRIKKVYKRLRKP